MGDEEKEGRAQEDRNGVVEVDEVDGDEARRMKGADGADAVRQGAVLLSPAEPGGGRAGFSAVRGRGKGAFLQTGRAVEQD